MNPQDGEQQCANTGTIAAIVCKDLRLPLLESNIMDNEDELLLWLEAQIGHLLTHDPHRLMQALYRIDVDEEKVRQSFSHVSSTARLLSQHVIERIRTKLEYRKKYRASGAN
jgi:hypothetical protein